MADKCEYFFTSNDIAVKDWINSTLRRRNAQAISVSILESNGYFTVYLVYREEE